MSQTRTVPIRPAPPSQELREVADKLLGSATFSRSPRLRAFLAYVADCTAGGRAGEINEYSLGVQVFGKPANYAPNEDNIVRVTARQLRVKLDEYYRSEGAQDAWRLVIPKGGYVPELTPNEPRRPQGAGAFPAAWRRAAWTALALSGWVVAALTFSARPAPPAPAPLYLLEEVFAQAPGPVLCLLDDPLLPLSYQDRDRFPELNEFLNGFYRNPLDYSPERRKHLFDLVARNEFVRPHTLQFLLELSVTAASRAKRIRAVHARAASPAMLGEGSAIVLGGIGSNPWVGAFQPHLAFIHRIDPQARRRYFENRWPRPGEQEAYISADGPPDPPLYTRIAVMPNPFGRGKVALLGGTSRQSTEGAWQFAFSQRGVEEIRARCGAEPGQLAQFEAILQTTALGTTPMDWKIEAVRCGPNPPEARPAPGK